MLPGITEQLHIYPLPEAKLSHRESWPSLMLRDIQSSAGEGWVKEASAKETCTHRGLAIHQITITCLVLQLKPNSRSSRGNQRAYDLELAGKDMPCINVAVEYDQLTNGQKYEILGIWLETLIEYKNLTAFAQARASFLNRSSLSAKSHKPVGLTPHKSYCN